MRLMWPEGGEFPDTCARPGPCQSARAQTCLMPPCRHGLRRAQHNIVNFHPAGGGARQKPVEAPRPNDAVHHHVVTAHRVRHGRAWQCIDHDNVLGARIRPPGPQYNRSG